MRRNHEAEKTLYYAVSKLASEHGSLQDRLCNAFLTLHHLKTEELPPDLQADFAALTKALTASQIPGDEDDEERVRATTSAMSHEEASQWEAKILEMQDRISR